MSQIDKFSRLCYNIKALGGLEIHLLDVVRIGLDASKIIMNVYTDLEYKWNIKYKELDNSPVTVADLKANEFICNQLTSKWSKIPIVSEESKIDEWKVRRNNKVCWFVDPLDGTKEFIKRNGEFTVNIGLVEDGVPVLGVVCIPVKGIAYVSNSDIDGAYRISTKSASNNLCDQTVFHFIPRNMSDPEEINEIRIIGSPNSKQQLFKAFIDKYFPKSNTRFQGSSLKFIEIIEGNADVYPRFLDCMEWDTCACHILMKQTCGDIYQVNVSEFDEAPRFSIGEPLVYNKENLVNPFFVALSDRVKMRLLNSRLYLQHTN